MAVLINGLDALMSKLASLGGNCTEALVLAVNRTTLAAQTSAKRLAPVDTSNLKQNILTKFEPGGEHYSGVVFDDVEYALYQEFGTSIMDAHPFMLPALKENEQTFYEEAKNCLTNAIRKRGG